jgi:hypothetical protein
VFSNDSASWPAMAIARSTCQGAKLMRRSQQSRFMKPISSSPRSSGTAM